MSVMLFFFRCVNDKFADGGHDLQMTRRSESTRSARLFFWRVEVYSRWCCGTDLLFASVIAICFVFFEWFFGCFCAVRVSVVSGSAH